MARRLVLGCGALGGTVIDALAERGGELRVIDDDEARVETLRGKGITADHSDPADRDSLAAAESLDTVIVAEDDSVRNAGIATVAREAFPGAYLIVFVGPEADVATRNRIEGLADRTVDHVRAIAGAAIAAGGEESIRLRELRGTLESIPGRLGVFTHNDPDPDAIGSALALCDIADTLGVEAEACYFGDIAHQENRALVNLLDLELTRIDQDGFDPQAFGGIALVDHSRPGVNDYLPPGASVDVAIDHHPPRGPVDGRFVDLRSNVGATSTLLVDYLEGLDVEVDSAVATALLYGIRVDTRDFAREITAQDFEAASFLLPRADTGILERVESPSVSGDTFDTVARAIKNCHREGSIAASSVGAITDRDAIAQAADQLLAMEGVGVTVVYGIMDDTVYVSGRTRGSEVDIGETMRRAFDGIGSAGGHTDMAGAQLPIGILGQGTDDESLESTVGEVITARLFEELRTTRPPSRVDRSDAELFGEPGTKE